MWNQLRSACVMILLLTVLTGVVYPLAVTALAQAIFPHEANGSLIRRGDDIVGSELIGQAFAADKHFWGRPSATGPFAYNGVSSAGSNLGPTNPQFLQNVKDRATAIRAAHPTQQGPVPGDLVTASGSGLDPHISPAAAEYQVERVAQALGRPSEELRALVQKHTEGRTFGVLGEPRVNVLTLNLAIDQEIAR